MNDRLKQIIFNKLYEDLKHAEIIPYEDSIWLIDRETKYWYFEFKRSEELWWRWHFFSNFFALFSLKRSEYEPLIVEFADAVLNYEIKNSACSEGKLEKLVGDALNHKINNSHLAVFNNNYVIDQVLNCKIKKSNIYPIDPALTVEKILNYEVKTSRLAGGMNGKLVNEVLCRGVATSNFLEMNLDRLMGRILTDKNIQNEQ